MGIEPHQASFGGNKPTHWETVTPILEEELTHFPSDLLDDGFLPSSTERWRALYTKPRHEKSVARHLHARDVPFYLPLQSKTNYFRGRSVTSLLPVFPSYVFVLLSDAEREIAYKTNRVISILDVPDGARLRRELRQVRRLLASRVPITIESHIQPGERVRVRLGPLTGLEGTVLQRRGETRLFLSVDFLHRGASVLIHDYMLESLQGPVSRLAISRV